MQGSIILQTTSPIASKDYTQYSPRPDEPETGRNKSDHKYLDNNRRKNNEANNNNKKYANKNLNHIPKSKDKPRRGNTPVVSVAAALSVAAEDAKVNGESNQGSPKSDGSKGSPPSFQGYPMGFVPKMMYPQQQAYAILTPQNNQQHYIMPTCFPPYPVMYSCMSPAKQGEQEPNRIKVLKKSYSPPLSTGECETPKSTSTENDYYVNYPETYPALDPSAFYQREWCNVNNRGGYIQTQRYVPQVMQSPKYQNREPEPTPMTPPPTPLAVDAGSLHKNVQALAIN